MQNNLIHRDFSLPWEKYPIETATFVILLFTQTILLIKGEPNGGELMHVYLSNYPILVIQQQEIVIISKV